MLQHPGGRGGDIGAESGRQPRAHRQFLAHRGVLAEPIKNAAEPVGGQFGVGVADEGEYGGPLADFRDGGRDPGA